MVDDAYVHEGRDVGETVTSGIWSVEVRSSFGRLTNS